MLIKEYPSVSSLSDNDLFLVQTKNDDAYKNITKADLLSALSISSQNNGSSYNVVSNGLIADYRFNELQGNTLKDNSTNKYDGTINPNTSWINYANCGLDFQNNGYVQLPNSVWLNGDLTIEAVINPRSYQRWCRIVDFGNGGAVDNLYFALSQENSGKPVFGVLNGNGGNPFITSNIPVTINQWSHWMVSLSGNTATIFNNLAPVASGNTIIPTNQVKTVNYIGRSAFNGDGRLDGSIATIRMWNKALSTNERIQEFLATRSILASQGILF